VREWIEKSEGDYLTATREAKADPPNYTMPSAFMRNSALRNC